MELQRISSFSVDHRVLERGVYTSRIDSDVVTYDIRMKRPNRVDYLPNPVLHTFEHLFATYARSSFARDGVIYVGPMGCRTGFYLVVRGLSEDEVLRLVRESFAFIADFAGEIPGATEPECGNYLEQDLPGARAAAAEMLPVLRDWTSEKLTYTAFL